MTRLMFSFVFILLTMAASCQEATDAGKSKQAGSKVNATLSLEQFKAKLDGKKNYILVDVRTPEEFGEGHIEGARNIDVQNGETFDAEFNKLDTKKTVLLYCRSGKRSRKAADKLEAMGFRKVYDLKGGFLAWENE